MGISMFHSRYKDVDAIQVNIIFTLGQHTHLRRWVSLDPWVRRSSQLMVDYLRHHYRYGTPPEIYQPKAHKIIKDYLRGGTGGKGSPEKVSIRFSIPTDLHKSILGSAAEHELLVQDEMLSALFYGVDHAVYPDTK